MRDLESLISKIRTFFNSENVVYKIFILNVLQAVELLLIVIILLIQTLK